MAFAPVTHGSKDTRALHPRAPCGTPARVCPLLPLVSLSTKPANHLKWQFWACNSPAENPPSAFHCSWDTERTSHLHKDVSHSIRSSGYLDRPPSLSLTPSTRPRPCTGIADRHPVPQADSAPPHSSFRSPAAPRGPQGQHNVWLSYEVIWSSTCPVAHELQKAGQSIPFVHHSSPQMYS